jgi:hypothetical protein
MYQGRGFGLHLPLHVDHERDDEVFLGAEA